MSNLLWKREGALQSQDRAEIELRGNYSIRSPKEKKLEIRYGTWETGNGTFDLGTKMKKVLD